MSGGHVHALYRHGAGPLHRMHPEVKIAATLLFVITVVATPRHAVWAFGVHAAIVVGLMAAGRLPPRFVARRLLVALPFVLFAAFLPFLGGGARIEALGISLSEEGLWAAWNVLAKALIGASASIVLAATTQVPDILTGLTRLKAPRVIVSIMGFMVRYLDVVIGEFGRMRVALRSRGFAPRRIRDARPLAATLGTLFVRSYERGERVYLAMLGRGYAGAMPVIPGSVGGVALQWAAAAGLVALAAATAAAGWML